MKTIIFKKNNIREVIDMTLKTLKSGGLVISPSDTVYGLLVDATNAKAVDKLIQFKDRPRGSPISVFVADFSMLEKQVNIKSQQMQLLRQLLPGPFTVVLASKHQVSPALESEKGTLGVRIPDDHFINQLVKKFRKPVSATSANLSGRSPHYSIRTLLSGIPEKKKKLIDLVIDAGVLPRNKPSTVIDLTSSQIKIVRQGDILFKDEETFISNSPAETKKIAVYLLKKILKNKGGKALVFILKGELGVGKTVFVKGLGNYLGIKNVVSPTFVVYYEYVSINQLIDTFIHVDLYNVQESEEFRYLGLEKYLKKGNLLCFEWGEKAGEIVDLLKQKAEIIYVKMKYVDEKRREIQINF